MRTGISTDTVLTRDAYFFNALPGEEGQLQHARGNIKAGTALKDAGEITAAADVTLWNGSVYPDAQPAAVKRAARQCDFLTFIGRGYVRITGRPNYTKFSNKSAAARVGRDEHAGDHQRRRRDVRGGDPRHREEVQGRARARSRRVDQSKPLV